MATIEELYSKFVEVIQKDTKTRDCERLLNKLVENGILKDDAKNQEIVFNMKTETAYVPEILKFITEDVKKKLDEMLEWIKAITLLN